MIFTSTNLKIQQTTHEGRDCLHFKFKGKFNQEIVATACEAWSGHMAVSRSRWVLIWDCEEMTGFEMPAKNEWLRTLSQVDHHVEKVIVISDNTLIRGAARLMFKMISSKFEIIKPADQQLTAA